MYTLSLRDIPVSEYILCTIQTCFMYASNVLLLTSTLKHEWTQINSYRRQRNLKMCSFALHTYAYFILYTFILTSREHKMTAIKLYTPKWRIPVQYIHLLTGIHAQHVLYTYLMLEFLTLACTFADRYTYLPIRFYFRYNSKTK